MPLLLVLHNVADEERRARIIGTLKRHHRVSATLTDSALALHTTLLPVRVFDEVKQLLVGDDQLYVIPLRPPYTGFGPRDRTEWLSTYLSS